MYSRGGGPLGELTDLVSGEKGQRSVDEEISTVLTRTCRMLSTNKFSKSAFFAFGLEVEDSRAFHRARSLAVLHAAEVERPAKVVGHADDINRKKKLRLKTGGD